MATQGIEEVTENAIRAVARDCGSLSMECSDVAGYVAGVSEPHRRASEDARPARGSDRAGSTTTSRGCPIRPTRRGCCREQAKAKLEAGRDAIDDTIAGFKGLTELVVQLGERMAGFASAMNQVQTVSSTIETIARKTNMLALERDHRGRARRRCRAQLRGRRGRSEEARPRHPRRDQPDRRPPSAS